MEQLEQSHPVSVHWRSFELRPKGAPPISPEYRARIEANRPRLYAIARDQYGLEMNPGPFDFDSRPALIGAKFAERMGAGPAYHAAVMKAHWLEARRIDDVVLLADMAESIGLERAAFLSALTDPAMIAEVQADIERAQAYGLNSVPAMVFADKYLVSGAQPYPVLTQVVDEIQRETGKE